MEFKGTKGEWIIKPNAEPVDVRSVINDEDGNYIAEVWRFEDGEIDERNANAKLIAAAPELLASIIDLKEVIDQNVSVVFPEDTWSLIEAVDNAITKALK